MHVPTKPMQGVTHTDVATHGGNDRPQHWHDSVTAWPRLPTTWPRLPHNKGRRRVEMGAPMLVHTRTQAARVAHSLIEEQVLALKPVRHAQPHTRGQRAPPRAKRAPHLGLMTPSSSEEPRCRSSRTLCPRTRPVLVPLHCSATRLSLKPTGVTF